MGIIDFIEKPKVIGSSRFPGLPILPHGVERHVVPGGGSRGISIEKGDEIAIIDREGLQLAEMVFFDPSGRSDAAMLGAKGCGRADYLIKLLSSGDYS